MNFIYIAGHLGADPVTRYTPSGQKVTNFNVATNVRKGGKDETVWYRVTVWGDRFDKMMAYLKKGSAVIVVGELGKPEIWVDKQGQTQVTLEITAETLRFSPFGKPDRQGQEGQEQNTQAAGYQTGYSASNGGFGSSGFGGGGYGNGAGGGFGGQQQQQQQSQQGFKQQPQAAFEDEEPIPF